MEFGGSQIGFLIWLLAAVVQTSPAPRNRAQRFAVRRNAGKPGPNPDAVRAGAGEARQIRGNLGYNPFSLPPSLDPRSPPPPPPPLPRPDFPSLPELRRTELRIKAGGFINILPPPPPPFPDAPPRSP